MDKAGLSSKASQLPLSPTDDIPEALRENQSGETSSKFPIRWWFGGIVGIGVISIVLVWYSTQFAGQTADIHPPTSVPSPSVLVEPPSPSHPAVQNTLLGHFPYQEAPAAELESIVPDGTIKMRKAAAQKWQEMVTAAAAEGISLVPISGFRSISDQQYLFFDVKAERGEVAAERAAVSAPPGYSEHHTGYAVDIGAGDVPATNLSPDFENTAAYKWLKANAAHFSFELSFPKNNAQGVSYEPWHWRFVGDRQSLETFYKAKQIKPQLPHDN